MRLHPGEIEAAGRRVEKVSDVVHRLRDASPDVAGRPRVIAIDGRGGSGKSTIVEGAGIIRDEFAPWLDASIWMQGDLDEQERRLVARDGDSAAERQMIAEWLAEELPLLLRERPWEKATIIVAGGSTQLRHDPDTELVTAPSVVP